jgi:hypothetical protein
MMSERFWDGKAVHVVDKATRYDQRCVEIGLTPEAARKATLALMKLRQTYVGMGPGPEVEELLTALNYVLVGDPASVAAHQRMEAAKGMDPAGADRRSYGPAEDMTIMELPPAAVDREEG